MKRIDLIAQNGNDGLHYVEETKDSVVESVTEAYKQRSSVGIEKYGVTLDRTDLNVLDWLQHLQEELMDATLYVEKLKKEFNHLNK
jgi:hypothetical protein